MRKSITALCVLFLASPAAAQDKPPRIDSVSPRDVLPDESVFIYFFGSFHPDTTVSIEGVGPVLSTTQVPEWEGGIIAGYTQPLPDGVSPGWKSVTVSDSRGSDTLPGSVLYVNFGDPYIKSCSPSEVAPEGGTVTSIHGRNFRDGLVPAFHSIDDESTLYVCTEILEVTPDRITVVLPPIPARSTPGDYYTGVLLDGPGGPVVASRGSMLIVLEGTRPPLLTSVEPQEVDARGGTALEVHGQNLRSASYYYLGPTGLARSVEAVSDELIRCVAPAMEPNEPGAAYDVLVADGRGESLLSNAIRSVYRIRSVTPAVVERGSSVLLTFDGYELEDGFRLEVGSTLLDSPVFVDSTRMRGTLDVNPASFPPGSYAAYLVDGSDGGIVGYLPGAVTVEESGSTTPHIVSVSPSQVSTRGADAITVTLDSPAGSAVILVGDKTLVNLDASNPPGLRGEVPPLDAGFYPVDLVSTSGELLDSLPAAIEAVDPQGITISSVSPFEVATTGGTLVSFSGTGFELGMTPRLGGFVLTGVEVIDGEHLRGYSPELPEGPHAATLGEGTTPLARLDDAVTALPIDSGVPIVASRPASSRFLGGVDTLSISVAGAVSGAILRVGGVEVLSTIPTDPCRFGAGGGGGGGGVGVETVGGKLEGKVPELPPGIYAVDIYLPGKGILKVLDDAVEVAGSDAPPLVSHVVSTEVARDGSTRLYIFGSGFTLDTEIRIAGKPLLDPSRISSHLIIGNAPPLDETDDGGIKSLDLLDPRGDSSISAAVSYAGLISGRQRFVRGDSNDSGKVDISDAVTTLGYLFLGNPQSLACAASADIDANGKVDITDPIRLLQHLFLGGPEPAAPYPTCGLVDPPSSLGCAAFSACRPGGGGAVATGSLNPNVYVLNEARVAAGDPVVRDLDPVTGQVVIDDPPGGLDLKSGDIIAGFVPPASSAIYESVTYLLKLEDTVPSSCLATSASDAVFSARSAGLSEVFQNVAINTTIPGIKEGVRLPPGSATVSGRTNCLFDEGAGGAVKTDGGGGLFDPLIDVDFSGHSFFHWQDGPNFVDAGFNRLRVKYAASEASLGLTISGGGVRGVTFFSGILLDSEIELYLSSHFEKHIHEEKKLLSLRKDYVVLVIGVPIHFAATGDLFAGIDMDAHVNLYVDAGAKASFKAGLGVAFDGSGFHNVSGFDPPAFDTLPGTPDIDLNGSVVAKAYLRPEVHFFAGILFRGLTADLGIRCEAFTRFHAAGSTKPFPCFNWGIDAGLTATLNPEIQLFGKDLFDETEEVLHEEELNLLGGEYGCHFPPVARVSYSTVKLLGDRFEVHLDASASYDPDGGPLLYRWDFDGDGQCDFAKKDPRTTYISDRACPFDELTELFSVCGRGRMMRLQVTDDEGVSTNKVFKVLLQ